MALCRAGLHAAQLHRDARARREFARTTRREGELLGVGKDGHFVAQVARDFGVGWKAAMGVTAVEVTISEPGQSPTWTL